MIPKLLKKFKFKFSCLYIYTDTFFTLFLYMIMNAFLSRCMRVNERTDIMTTELIRLKDVSKKLNLSTATLRKYIHNGKLKAIKVGGNYMVNINDYDEFVFNLYVESLGLNPAKVKEYLENEAKKELEQELNKLMKQIDLIKD